MKKCNSCGTSCDDNAKFCGECGAKVSDVSCEIPKPEDAKSHVPSAEVEKPNADGFKHPKTDLDLPIEIVNVFMLLLVLLAIFYWFWASMTWYEFAGYTYYIPYWFRNYLVPLFSPFMLLSLALSIALRILRLFRRKKLNKTY